jgi:hypothetical protein
MIPESIPIVIDTTFDEIEIYPIHDLHYGDENFDSHKWNELTKLILSKPNAMVAFVGDLMQAAIPNSKSDMFTQKATLREQQDFVTSIFKQFAGRICAIVDGNHEDRCARTCGLFPLYTSACLAGESVEDKYRSTHAVVDIGLKTNHEKPSRVVGFICHKSKDLKSFSSVDSLEGFDFMFSGHDHEPRDHARGHLCYDRQRREIKVRSVEFLNSGSFLTYGGYGARAGYRPKSDKMYKLIVRNCGNRQKAIETVGFYI